VLDARRLIESQFPEWSNLPITPVEPQGWDNRSFRLGSELVVRLPSAEAYAAQVEREQRWLPVLAPQLPLPIPRPIAQGEPDSGYPYPWSVYEWLEGEPASAHRVTDMESFAAALAGFLNELRSIDPSGGPEPGIDNFFRGGPLATYEDETLTAIDALGDQIAGESARRVWAEATDSSWTRDPVWFHGDVAPENLLVRDGRLAAVIDFGLCGVGDPACDTVIAWTFLTGPGRDRFRAELDVDPDTWRRGRGWALWKALISQDRRVIDQVLADHAHDR
jgi:aminoglycoside phosphotransferase (APT) family kinase protein